MPRSNLPSKQFLIRGGIATAIIVIILIVQTNWFKNVFLPTKKDTPVVAPVKTIGDVVGKDTNGNGIADWEETLWGLDPAVLYTNGRPNKEIIEEKKKALGVKEEDSSVTLNETDTIARQLFAITTALGQANEVDPATLQDVAGTLSGTISKKPIANHYSAQDIKRIPTTTTSLKTYYDSINTSLGKLDQETADTELIVAALENGDFSQIDALEATATNYKKIAATLRTIPVPIGVAQYHLDIINGFYGIADSFSLITQFNDNGINGLIGISIYQKYNHLLQDAAFQLHQYLIQYGILES